MARLPDYLSQGGIDVGPSIPNLRAGLVRDPGTGINLGRAAQIRAPSSPGTGGSLRPAYLTPEIDKVGPVVNSEQLANFAGLLGEYAFQKADKQDELEAKELIVSTNEKLRAYLFGDQGIFHKQGKEFMDAREGTQLGVEKIVDDALGSVEHAVRAKAFESIYAEREQMMDNVARESVRQMGIWEANTRNLEIQDHKNKMPEFNANPDITHRNNEALIFKVYPGKTPQDELNRMKLRDELSQLSIEYQAYNPNGGIGAMHQRLIEFGPNMTPEGQIKAQKFATARTNQYNAEQRAREAEEDRTTARVRNNNAAEYWARQGGPAETRWSNEKLLEGVRLGIFPPGLNQTIIRRIEGGTDKVTDWAFVGEMNEKLPYLEGPEALTEWINALSAGPVKDTDVGYMVKKAMATQDTVNGVQRRRHEEVLKLMSQEQAISGNQLTTTLNNEWYMQLSMEYDRRIATEDPESVINSMQQDTANRLTTQTRDIVTTPSGQSVRWVNLPPLMAYGQSRKPKDYNDFEAIMQQTAALPRDNPHRLANEYQYGVYMGYYQAQYDEARQNTTPGNYLDKGYEAYLNRRLETEEKLEQQEAARRPEATAAEPAAQEPSFLETPMTGFEGEKISDPLTFDKFAKGIWDLLQAPVEGYEGSQ